MFKLELKYSVLGYMNLFAHELGLLQLRLNILDQKTEFKNNNGGIL